MSTTSAHNESVRVLCVCVCVVVLGKGGGNDVCPLSSLWRLHAHLYGGLQPYGTSLHVHIKSYPVPIDLIHYRLWYNLYHIFISPQFLINFLFIPIIAFSNITSVYGVLGAWP